MNTRPTTQFTHTRATVIRLGVAEQYGIGNEQIPKNTEISDGGAK